MKNVKIHYIKINNNKYCAHTQYLCSSWTPSICYKVSKLVPTLMPFLGSLSNLVFLGYKIFSSRPYALPAAFRPYLRLHVGVRTGALSRHASMLAGLQPHLAAGARECVFRTFRSAAASPVSSELVGIALHLEL
ncbi:hypothetical protein NX775_05090 [Massilia aurea]|uniref:hypothetical protein n=1 Tax=Massilia aurea TaxID=373040 RepID=UPI0021632D6E|nr:hypothetical protein [Massilia aurea]MCS0706473.1 hypothetical protein [Massilia aurea]